MIPLGATVDPILHNIDVIKLILKTKIQQNAQHQQFAQKWEHKM